MSLTYLIVGTNSAGDIGIVFSALISLIIVLALAYFCIRWLAGRSGIQRAAGSAIKVIDRVGIGQDRALLIVSVDGKYMLIGVTDGGINKLCDLDDFSIEKYEKQKTAGGFSAIMEKATRGLESRSKKKDEDKEDIVGE